MEEGIKSPPIWFGGLMDGHGDEMWGYRVDMAVDDVFEQREIRSHL